MKRRIGIVVMSIISLCIAGVFIFQQINKGTRPNINVSKREIWKSEVYDYIIETDREHVIIYNHTKDSLLPFAYGRMEKDGTIYADKLHGNPLLNIILWKSMPFGKFQNGALKDDMGYVKHFSKIEELPRVKNNSFTKNPVQNFEVFWQIFDENYSLFGLMNFDWKQIYDEYKSKVTQNTSQDELRQIFKEMILKLDDRHIQVITGISSISSKVEDNQRQKLYLDDHEEMQKNIRGYIIGGLKSKLNGRIQYGKMEKGFGYILLNSFDLFDKKEIDRALDEVVEEFEGNSGMIIDLRFNRKGSDAFALATASRFTNEKKLVFSKRVRSGSYYEFFEAPPIYIEPDVSRIRTNKIVVMTSQVTAGAGEIARMAFGEIEHVTVIGERTNGTHSDMLINILPNEWIVTLSAEQYIAADGNMYEKIGFKPDEEVLISEEDIKEGKDTVLEEAIEILKQR
ncbi:S41 family peptidase [Tissierella sp.]|uniref:S41 family peptidase n=1 Tax=Tissierella sp. TaxID=41274 RepID=UPI00304C7F21